MRWVRGYGEARLASSESTQDELKARIPGHATIEQASGGATVLDELEQRVAEAEAPEAPEPSEAPEADDPAPTDAPTASSGPVVDDVTDLGTPGVEPEVGQDAGQAGPIER